MENFFSSMDPWRKSEGSLHLYVLPAEEELERFAAAQAAVAGIEHLPLMPEGYLHLTLQRLGQFDEEVTQGDYTRLGDALETLCSSVESFELDFSGPEPGATSLLCRAAPSKQWDDLVNGSRGVVETAWGLEPPAAPDFPHLSLAYATGEVSDESVRRKTAELEPIGAINVAAIHLVSVTVRPQRGTFDFTSLANWDLAPRT